MQPKLFRRRFIPEEIVHLKNDKILFINEEKIITKWSVLKPRKDFSFGYSYYLINRGFKISKFYSESWDLLYTYCDIIQTEINKDDNAIIFSDLLIDVIIYANGFVKVMDLGEIAEALDKKLITEQSAKVSLKITDELLSIIYSGRLCEYTNELDFYINQTV